MVKPELNDLISWLHNGEANRFEIYDVDRGRSLEKCASFSDLSKKFKNPEGYFKNLADDGVRTIQIAQKRKNGSSYVREDCAWNYGLSTNGNAISNVAASGQSGYPAATPQQYKEPSNGLGSPAMGLSGPEIRMMQSQSDRYGDKEKENTALLLEIVGLKSEIKTLVSDCRKYEKENDRFQYGAENKPTAVDKLFEGIAANPAVLSQIIQSIRQPAALPGLNSPQSQTTPQLSDTKSTVVDLVANNPQLTDEHVTAAYYVLVEALKGNKAFLQDYFKILENYKLIDNGSNHNNNGNF